MRNLIVIMLFATATVIGCKAPMPPSDEMMIRHFNMHEAAFSRICEIMTNSSKALFHYPPLEPDHIFLTDSTGKIIAVPKEEDRTVFGLSKQMRTELDSLLSDIGCRPILVNHSDSGKTVSIVFSFYTHGYSIGGTSKSFIYNTDLRKSPLIQMTEHGDLNKIYRRNFNDTILYKPINENWYIMLEHDN